MNVDFSQRNNITFSAKPKLSGVLSRNSNISPITGKAYIPHTNKIINICAVGAIVSSLGALNAATKPLRHDNNSAVHAVVSKVKTFLKRF